MRDRVTPYFQSQAKWPFSLDLDDLGCHGCHSIILAFRYNDLKCDRGGVTGCHRVSQRKRCYQPMPYFELLALVHCCSRDYISVGEG
jgi:hypothetical protein